MDLSTFRERKNYLTKYSNFIILSSRGFRPIYNVDSIVKSIPYVIEKYPNVKYILKTLPGSQNPELQQLAVSLNVIKYTEFISKMIDFNELPEMLYSVDIFISVPSSDSSSISLLEAMACGLPVIVSDIPVFREIYENIPIYIELGNKLSWEESFVILNDKSIVKEKINQGVKKAKEYTEDKMYDSLISSLTKIWSDLY